MSPATTEEERHPTPPCRSAPVSTVPPSTASTSDGPTLAATGTDGARSHSLLRVRFADPQALTPRERLAWRRLTLESVERNPYLSPDFVLPLVTACPQPTPVQLMIVEETRTGEWRAVGVLESSRRTWKRPLRFLRGLSSPYSFLDGLLIDEIAPDITLRVLLSELSQQRDWHGIQFALIREDSVVAQWLDAAATDAGLSVYSEHRWQRARFDCHQEVTIDEILQFCSKSRRKSLRRARRLLERRGTVDYRLVTPAERNDPSVDTFLELEQLGWKGAEGTAIASNPAHAEFFRRVIDARGPSGGVIMGELRLDGRVVASTCNLRCGESLHAFKIGWDPELSDVSLGLWSEIELALAISTQIPEIRHLDSSSKVGSYLEAVWSSRQNMRSVVYSWSRRGHLLMAARSYYRWWKSTRG